MTKIKTKVSSFGKNLSLTMERAKFAELSEKLPQDSEERKIIEKMLKDAEKQYQIDCILQEYRTPLSRLNLSRFGWDVLPNDGGTIHAGVRHGDFRQNTNGTWTFGPTGAFENSESPVIRHDAWQVGVFCSKRAIYLLEEPSLDGKEAYRRAEELEKEWVSLFSNAKKVAKKDYPSGTTQHEGWLPHDYRTLVHQIYTAKDDVAFGKRERGVYVLKFDAQLIVDYRDEMQSIKWGVSRNLFKSGMSEVEYHYDGPFDCIIENVWGAVTNSYKKILSSPSESFPYIHKKQADAAARQVAAHHAIIDEEPGDMPEPLGLPAFTKVQNETIF